MISKTGVFIAPAPLYQLLVASGVIIGVASPQLPVLASLEPGLSVICTTVGVAQTPPLSMLPAHTVVETTRPSSVGEDMCFMVADDFSEDRVVGAAAPGAAGLSGAQLLLPPAPPTHSSPLHPDGVGDGEASGD